MTGISRHLPKGYDATTLRQIAGTECLPELLKIWSVVVELSRYDLGFVWIPEQAPQAIHAESKKSCLLHNIEKIAASAILCLLQHEDSEVGKISHDGKTGPSASEHIIIVRVQWTVARKCLGSLLVLHTRAGSIATCS